MQKYNFIRTLCSQKAIKKLYDLVKQGYVPTAHEKEFAFFYPTFDAYGVVIAQLQSIIPHKSEANIPSLR